MVDAVFAEDFVALELDRREAEGGHFEQANGGDGCGAEVGADRDSTPEAIVAPDGIQDAGASGLDAANRARLGGVGR